MDHPTVRPCIKRDIDNKGVSERLRALVLARRGISAMIIIIHIFKAKYKGW